MTRLAIDVLRTEGFAAIAAASGDYVTVGAPTAFPMSMFRITNNTDGDMIFSINGTTDQLFVPAMSFVLYDIAANSPQMLQGGALMLAIGVQWYVRESTAPTKGAVWIESPYAVGV
jgi:hypothetical protein